MTKVFITILPLVFCVGAKGQVKLINDASLPPMIRLTIAGFRDGGNIPLKHTCAGSGQAGLVSPAMQWRGAPSSTRAYVLIVRDSDAVGPIANGLVTDDVPHWAIFNIPGTATGLPEHVPHQAELPDGSRQLAPPLAQRQSSGGAGPPPPPAKGASTQADEQGPGYFGPCAPAGHGSHHYVFELWALNAKLDLTAAATLEQLMRAMNGKVVAKAYYVGMFGQ